VPVLETKSYEIKYQPICMLAHDLVNRLSVIIGHCDLMAEENPENFKLSQHLDAVREMAKSSATALKDHLCQLDAMRIGAGQTTTRTRVNSHDH